MTNSPDKPTITIPIFDPRREIEVRQERFDKAILGTVASGHFIGGPAVKTFESNAGAYLRTEHAVGMNSGSDALVLALHALGIGPGDEVITTPFTFIATASAISRVGATPVFVDIDPETYNIDVSRIEAAVTDATRAILPVHLYGHPCDMDKVMSIARSRDLAVVEDAAQSFGSQYNGNKLGTIGHVGTFSFFPTKILGAFGDGGMACTDDPHLAQRLSMLRVHGAKRKYYNEVIGYNSRLDAIQAAVLDVKLEYIEENITARREAAQYYNEQLADIDGIMLPVERENCKHVYHQYTIRIGNERRAEVQSSMADDGVGTMVYYPVPVHLLPVYADDYRQDRHPVAEQLAEEVLSLPMGPGLTRGEQDQVVSSLRNAIGKSAQRLQAA